jgi:serine/threonine protein kinase
MSNDQVMANNHSPLFMREGEECSYMGFIGSGGYGEIHKVLTTSLSLIDPQVPEKLDFRGFHHHIPRWYIIDLPQFFARKILRPFAGRNSNDEIANETRAMEKLCKQGHENLIEIFDHGMLGPNVPFYFIDMELCGLNLDEYVRGVVTGVHGLLDWSQAVQEGQGPFQIFAIFQQIVIGLIFIHNHGEVHRDLTPQNSKYKIRFLLICSSVLANRRFLEDCRLWSHFQRNDHTNAHHNGW